MKNLRELSGGRYFARQGLVAVLAGVMALCTVPLAAGANTTESPSPMAAIADSDTPLAAVASGSAVTSIDGIAGRARNDDGGVRNDEMVARNSESARAWIAGRARNDDGGVRNDEMVARNSESARAWIAGRARNDDSGVRNDDSGVRNDDGGVRNDAAAGDDTDPSLRPPSRNPLTAVTTDGAVSTDSAILTDGAVSATDAAIDDSSATDAAIASDTAIDDATTDAAVTTDEAITTGGGAKKRGASPASATEFFKLKITTANANQVFTLPTCGWVGNTSNTYDWTITWGDGTAAEPKQGSSATNSNGIPHTYAAAGSYTITIEPTDPDATGWMRAFGFWDGTGGASNAQGNKDLVTGVMSPFTVKMTRRQAEIDANTAVVNEMYNMFNGCRNLKDFSSDFNLAQNITAVGDNYANQMFGWCYKLVSLPTGFTLPQNLSTAGNGFAYRMFYNCTAMTAVPTGFKLPGSSLATVGNGFCQEMFRDCTVLVTIPAGFTLPPNLNSVGNDFCRWMFWDTYALGDLPAGFNFPQQLTSAPHSFARGMFAASGVTSFPANFNLPQSLVSVGDSFCNYAFARGDYANGGGWNNGRFTNMPQGFNLPPNLTAAGLEFCSNMFIDRTSLTSIADSFTIPHGLNSTSASSTTGSLTTYFATCMFQGCNQLQKVGSSFNLPTAADLTMVGDYFATGMFKDCSSLVHPNGSAGGPFTMPQGIVTCGAIFADSMFSGCSSLVNMGNPSNPSAGFRLPAGLTSVGGGFCNRMFFGCSKLESVSQEFTLPRNIVGNVGGNFAAEMFRNCSKLTMPSSTGVFYFPQGITQAGDGFANCMFVGCGNMSVVNDNSHEATPFTLPQSLLTVGNDFCRSMFDGCVKMEFPDQNKNFNLPPNITQAGAYFCAAMFNNCQSLTLAGTSLTFPADIDRLNQCFGYLMFSNCDSLTTLNADFRLPVNATWAGSNVFQQMFNNCDNLEKLNDQFQLPTGITSVDDYFCYQMFIDCVKLTEVNAGFTFPAGIASCKAQFAFEMFKHCHSLVKMNDLFRLPTGQTVVNGEGYCRGMFAECNKLEKVNDGFTFPAGIAGDVGDNFAAWMFVSCPKLTSVSPVFTFPTGITGFKSGFAIAMFSNCPSLVQMNANFNLPRPAAASTCGNSFAQDMFSSCANLIKVNDVFTLPQSMTSSVNDFCTNMFYNCRNMPSVGKVFNMPPNMNGTGSTFAHQMFRDCSNLVRVNDDNNFNLPQALQSVGNMFCRFMFSHCGSIVQMNPNFNLPPGITSAGSDCFAAMFEVCVKLEKMPAAFNMPQGIVNGTTSFAANMFNGCTSMTTVNSVFNMPQAMTTASSIFCGGMFTGCSLLTTVSPVFTMPQNMVTLNGDSVCVGMFTRCSVLTSVSPVFTFSQNITSSIGSDFAKEMFRECTALAQMNSNFNLPQGFTAIGSNFGYLMFSNCNNLTQVNDVFTLPQGTTGNVERLFAQQMFQGCTKLVKVGEAFNLPQNLAGTAGFNFAGAMFYGCGSLEYVSKGFTFPQGITAVAPLDYDGSSRFASEMFRGCNSLRYISKDGVFTMPQHMTWPGTRYYDTMIRMFYNAGGPNFQLDAAFRFPAGMPAYPIFYFEDGTTTTDVPPQYPPGTAGQVDPGTGKVGSYTKYNWRRNSCLDSVFNSMDPRTPKQNIRAKDIINGLPTPPLGGLNTFAGCRNIFYDWWEIPNNWGGGGVAWETTLTPVSTVPAENPRGTKVAYNVTVVNKNITQPNLYDGPTGSFNDHKTQGESNFYDGRIGQVGANTPIYMRASVPGTFSVPASGSNITDYETTTDSATGLPVLVVKSAHANGATLTFGFEYDTTSEPLAGDKAHVEINASLLNPNQTSGDFYYQIGDANDQVAVTTYYDMVYHGNAAGTTGSAPDTAQHVRALTDMALPGDQGGLVKDGYTFTGWTTEDRWVTPPGIASTTAGDFYAKGASFHLADQGDAVSGTVRLHFYADWKVNTYTLSFSANGGVLGTTTSKTVTYDAVVGPVPTTGASAPTRTGYTFMGWSKDSGASNAVNVDASTVWKTAGNATWHAVWKAKTYTLGFNANGGTAGSVTSKTVTYDAIVGPLPSASPEAPARTGWTFKGWATGSALTAPNVNQNTVWRTDGGATWYAVWEANNYTVYFDKNTSDAGSTNPSPTSKQVTFAQPYGALPGVSGSGVAPTRRGYEFLGWANTAGASAPNVTPATTVTSSSNVTVSAVWRATTNNSLTFDANGGTLGSLVSRPGLTFNGPYTLPAYDSPASSGVNPTKTGYTFQGWVTNAAISTPGAAGYQLFPQTGTVDWVGNKQLYAAWDIDAYSVSFDINNPQYGGAQIYPQRVEHGQSASTPSGLLVGTVYIAHGNKKFLGWYANLADSAPYDFSSPVTRNITLHAKWEQWFMVTFANVQDSAGTAPFADQSVSPGGVATQPPDPVGPSGLTFFGWSTDSRATQGSIDNPGVRYDFSTPVTTDMAINGVWNPDVWSVTYRANGGKFSGGTTGDQSVEFIPYNESAPSPIGSPPVPYSFDASRDVPTGMNRLGYTFAAWNSAADGSGSGLPADGTVITSNAIYYATWQVVTYDISYDLGGGTNAAGNPTQYRVTDSFPMDIAAPTRAGFIFNGWTCDYDGSIPTNPADVTVPTTSFSLLQGTTGDIELRANWRANTFRVDYYGNGATSGTMAADTVTFGAAFALAPNAFEKAGHSFSGWNTAAGGGGASYAEGFDFANGASGSSAGAGWDISSNLALYAQWTPVTYTLTFDTNTDSAGASDANPSSKTVTFGSPIGALPGVGGHGSAPTRPGYDFAGWAYTPGGMAADVSAADIYTTPTDSAVYAVWTVPTYSFTRSAGAGGTVSGTASGRYTEGTAISVTATANSGYHFTGWTMHGASIAGGNAANPARFNMPAGAVTLTANFERDAAPPSAKHSFKRSAGTGGTVSGTASGSYAPGKEISVTAKAKSGYKFTGWTVSGATIEGGKKANPAKFDMPAGDVTIKANFNKDDSSEYSSGGSGSGGGNGGGSGIGLGGGSGDGTDGSDGSDESGRGGSGSGSGGGSGSLGSGSGNGSGSGSGTGNGSGSGSSGGADGKGGSGSDSGDGTGTSSYGMLGTNTEDGSDGGGVGGWLGNVGGKLGDAFGDLGGAAGGAIGGAGKAAGGWIAGAFTGTLGKLFKGEAGTTAPIEWIKLLIILAAIGGFIWWLVFWKRRHREDEDEFEYEELD